MDEIASQISHNFITQEVRSGLRDKIQKAIDSEYTNTIKAKIGEIVEGKLAEEVTPTNSYGEPIGKTTNLREMITTQVTKFLEEKVTERGDRAGYHDSGKPRIEWYIRNYCAAGLDKAIKTEIDAIKGEAVNSVKDTVAKLMAEKLTKKCDPVAF